MKPFRYIFGWLMDRAFKVFVKYLNGKIISGDESVHENCSSDVGDKGFQHQIGLQSLDLRKDN